MGRRFETTRWSMVLAARDGTTPSGRLAMAELCEAYWFPLWAFVRRQGFGIEDSRDMVQSFFLHLLEKDALRTVRPSGGRFRSFLLACLRNFLADERDRQRARKRGGGGVTLPLDLSAFEHRLSADGAWSQDPERIFETSWALTVIERGLIALEAELRQAGNGQLFDELGGCLTGAGPSASYREAAARLGRTEPAVRVAVHRMRKRLGELLREEVAHTVADESEVDGELRFLLTRV